MITKFTVLAALADLIEHRHENHLYTREITPAEAKRHFFNGAAFEIQSGELDGIYDWLISDGPSMKKCKRWAIGPRAVAWALLQEYASGVRYCDA